MPINEVVTIKNLGIYFDRHFTFFEHNNTITSKSYQLLDL